MIDNVRSEAEEYYKRVKYILDNSGWTAVRLQNLTNAIKEIGEGKDTHVTFELEADSPNLNAPGELSQSESLGAEEKQKTIEVDPEQEKKLAEKISQLMHDPDLILMSGSRYLVSVVFWATVGVFIGYLIFK
jgi:hypothetical protein